MQKFCSHHFLILGLIVTKKISENILTKFSSLATFPDTTPIFLKKKVKFSNIEFKFELIGIDFKSNE